MKLRVRPLQSADIDSIIAYWMQATPVDLERMGADASKLPAPEKFRKNLEEIIATPDEEKKTAYSIWLLDEKPIGFSSLKKIQLGESGEMHLHMWEAGVRGKGYGAVLFCLSADFFYENFRLKRIKCEPRSTNPFPNKMFQKIGFPLRRTHRAVSSELSLCCELNEYEISREIALRFLAQQMHK